MVGFLVLQMAHLQHQKLEKNSKKTKNQKLVCGPARSTYEFLVGQGFHLSQTRSGMGIQTAYRLKLMT